MSSSVAEIHVNVVRYKGLVLTCSDARIRKTCLESDDRFARIDIEDYGEIGIILTGANYPDTIHATVGRQEGGIIISGLPPHRVEPHPLLRGKQVLKSLHPGDNFSLTSGGKTFNFQVRRS